MGCGHDHSHRPTRKNKRRLFLVLLLTSLYLAAEVIGGLLTHSLALLADAGHLLTDVAGLALALFAIWFADKPATPERTYGYYRAEILAALVNAVILLGISVLILYEAYQRFRDPPEVASLPMLAVASLGLVVNAVGVLLLRKGAHDSLSLKSAYYELLSDTLTSVGVILAAIVMRVTGWYYADPIISAGIGLFILPRTWRLLWEAVGVLLEGTPADVNMAELRQALSEVPGVAGVHDLHVWSLTSGVNAMSVHAVLADGANHDAVLAAVRESAAHDFHISHVTVQVESTSCAATETHL